MLFNSIQYGVFLPIVFLIYWMIPHKYRWVLLLLSSYYFYMSWNPVYVLIILGITVVSYVCGLLVEKAPDIVHKRVYMLIAVVIAIAVIFVFKYFNFVSTSITELLGLFTIELSPVTIRLLLPVGISFYTFQTISYVIDIYKGDIRAERHFGLYATYVSFFPQLVAGPIERTDRLLPQIKEEKVFDEEMASYGIKRMLIGYFKKIVIADTVAKYVDYVYGDVYSFEGAALVYAALLFTIQIYCDFSGYSDIAIGTAKLMGIDLMINFRTPYFSKSIKEFWSRWHISLSTWFRDYVYIPLGGNRCSKFRRALNLMITFLLSGLWHGANWTYVVWGGLHGIAQCVENFFREKLPHKFSDSNIVCNVLRMIAVTVFVSFAWIFFRANSLSEAVYVIANLGNGIHDIGHYLSQGVSDIGINGNVQLVYIVGLLGLFTVIDVICYKCDIIEFLHNKNIIVRWGIYILIGVIVILFSRKGLAAEFVYFQF